MPEPLRIVTNTPSALVPEPEAAAPEEGAPAGPGRLLGLVEHALLVAGVGLFIALVYQIGFWSVTDNLRLLGWGFILVIGQEGIAAVANTLGWWAAFPRGEQTVGFARLFAARVAGDGINAVTPTATIGGEFVRVRMLEGQVDQMSLWASVAVAKISQTVGQVVFIVSGLLIAMNGTPIPPAIRHGLLISVPVFATLVGITVALQRRGLFIVAAQLMERLGVTVPAALRDRLQLLDTEIQRIYAAPSSFLWSVAFFLIGWMMGVVEVYLILYFLQAGASWGRALTIEALSATIDGMLFFVPAKIGTQEGGKVLIFALLGLDESKGLALGIARRIRELTWAGVAMSILSRWQLRKRPS